MARVARADLCVIATAAHVIAHAHHWEQPIRIVHGDTGKAVLLKEPDRAIFLDEEGDTASIAFANTSLPFPVESLSLTPEGHYLRVGSEIGWLGYPAVSPDTKCLFSGRVSAYLRSQNAYLVDGVAINGVSGGPVFSPGSPGDFMAVGVISAYIPNRATGEVLPGLCLVSDVVKLQEAVKSLDSLEQAKQGESPPTASAPEPSTQPPAG